MSAGVAIQVSDLASIAPKVDASATAAVLPAAAVAPNSNLTATEVASVTSAALGLSPPVPQVGLGAADFSFETAPCFSSRAPHLAGLTSAGSALSSRASIKNAIAFLVAAASKIISNSTSSVGA